jgi:hypothetical protein
VVALAVAAACGGGGSRDVGVLADDTSTTVAPTTTTSVASAAPGPNAKLSVSSIPAGWTFVTEERPPTAHGNVVILQVFEGPVVRVANPGGATAKLQVIVSATQIPDLVSSGRDQDLRALAVGAGPDDWTKTSSLTVHGRPALELERPVGPTVQREIVMALGDWRIHATGPGVTEDILQAFMDEVKLG